MKIYILTINDRHSDIDVIPFIDKDAAITEAKKLSLEYGEKYPEDIKEDNIDGWDYYCTYSCEGDYVRVTSHDLECIGFIPPRNKHDARSSIKNQVINAASRLYGDGHFSKLREMMSALGTSITKASIDDLMNIRDELEDRKLAIDRLQVEKNNRNTVFIDTKTDTKGE